MPRPVLVALLLLSACRSKAQPQPQPPGDAAPAVQAGPLDDLLHFTDATLAVSSRVDNPRDFAEHIADGRLDTAWNGRTGDLAGGWFGFRIPRNAHVRFFELTVGHGAPPRKERDLFLMNHRIARVRVSRDGTVLREHALDPDRRDFQRVPIDAPGGDFKVEVLATKPGTKPSYRELVVSEIRVFGAAGNARRPTPGIPRVAVGAFDDRLPLVRDAGAPGSPDAGSVPKASATSIDLLCARLVKEATATRTPEPRPPAKPDEDLGPCADADTTPSCSAKEIASEGDVTVFETHSRLERDERRLALVWNKKAIELPAVLESHPLCDLGCGGIDEGGDFLGLAVEGTRVTVTYWTWQSSPWPTPVTLPDGGFGPDPQSTSTYTRRRVVCSLGPRIECDETERDERTVQPHESPPKLPQGW